MDAKKYWDTHIYDGPTEGYTERRDTVVLRLTTTEYIKRMFAAHLTRLFVKDAVVYDHREVCQAKLNREGRACPKSPRDKPRPSETPSGPRR